MPVSNRAFPEHFVPFQLLYDGIIAADTHLDGGDVALQMNLAQRGLVDARVTAVQWITLAARTLGHAGSKCGAAVASKMFGARQHRQRILKRVALQASRGSRAQHLHHVGGFAVALIGPAPADVLGNCDTRGKRPIDSSSAHFFGGDASGLLHQCGIARASETDVVRKDHGANHIIVTVHGVDAIQQGNLLACF